MKKILLLGISTLFLFGCISPATAPMLNLQYQGIEKAAKSRPAKMSIVDTQFVATNTYGKMVSSPIMQLAASKGKLPFDMQVQQDYFTKYAPRIQSSLTSDIESLLQDKGFSIANSYPSFDEIPYEVRKNTDLLIVPTFDFAPNVHNSAVTIPIYGEIPKGTLQLIGRFEIAVVEPFSREKLIIKKVDVSSQTTSYSGADAGNAALVNLINSTYPEILQKAATLLDADEISAAVKSSKEIKKRTGF